MATNIQRWTSYVGALTNSVPSNALLDKVARAVIRDDVLYNSLTFDQKAGLALQISREHHLQRMRTWDAKIAEVSTAGQADIDLIES